MPVMMTTCLLVVTHGPARIMESGLERLQSVNVSNCHGLLSEFGQIASFVIQVDQIVLITFLLQ